MKNFLILASVFFGIAFLTVNEVQAQCPVQASVVTKTHTDITCFGATDGTITVDLADLSTSEPYNFELIDLSIPAVVTPSVTETENKPNRSVVYSNVPAGSYAVGFFKTGCTTLLITEGAFGFVVVEPAAIGITINNIDPDCDPAPVTGNGQIDLTVTGGTPPYALIEWTGPTAIPDGTEVTATNLDAGTYNIAITDANGCTFNQDIVVPVSTQADAGPLTGLTCGVNSFALSGNAPGVGELGTWTGPGGVTFSPNANDPNATANNLTVGVNTLTWTITDMGGFCLGSSDNIDVTYSDVLISGSPDVALNCFGDSNGAGAFTVTGGTPNFTYSLISNTAGASITLPPVGPITVVGFTGASAGVVTIQVQDASGCTSQSTITITQPTVLTAPFTQINASCFGGNDGSITITPAGGTSPYDFSIDGGATYTILAAANHTFNTLTAGTYNIRVRDANNCQTAVIPVTITEPVAVTAPFTQVNVSCFGGNDGSITITPAGGTSPYDFSIDGGATYPILNVASHTFNTLIAGTYNIRVRDANNCQTAVIPVTITQPAVALTAPFTQVNVSCFGGNDGSITITPAGGTSPYDFSIDGGATYPILNVASHTFNTLIAGTYNIRVRDANNCQTAVIPVTITQPAVALTAPFTQVNVSCFGGNDGSITITPAGGTSPYDFSIDGGATYPILNVASHTFNTLTAGTYNIRVRDANNCQTAVIPVTITQPAVALTAPFTQVNVSCFGGNDGSITITPAGGTSPYDFSIDGGATYPILNVASHTFNTLTSGTYNIRVRDANNCQTAVIPVTITQPAVALTAPFTQVNVSCFGGNDGSITITPAGGTSPYDFSIDGGATYPILNVASHTFNTLTSGTYNIRVRDANNCQTAVIPVTITQPAVALTAPFTQVNVSCFGGNDGSITITPAGGTSPYDFSIDGGATYPILNVASHTFNTLTAGTYNIRVRDANNCQTAVIPVTITEPIAITAPFTQVNVSCFGGNDGSITITPAGGASPYDFSIDGGATYPILNVASHTFNTLTAGTYNIRVRDANNCQTAVIPVTITQPAVALTAPFTQVNVSCFGGNDGSITITPAGGTSPYDFSIDGGATYPILNVASHTFSTLTAGTYNIRVRDANNCQTAVIPVTITQPVALSAPFTQVNVSCFGGNDGSITITPSNGTSPYDFSIDGGATYPILDVASHTFNTLTAGTYNIRVRDANNCQSAAIPVTITQPAVALTAPFTQINVSCFGGNDGSITITPAGGTSPYDFSIDGGATYPILNVASHTFNTLTAGTYNIRVRDANNCQTAVIPVTITQPAVALTAPFTQVNVSCFGGNNGSITITPAGGTSPYDFSIDGGATYPILDAASHMFTLLTAGTYNIRVRDANNCETSVIPVTLTEPGAVTITSTSKVDATCVGVNNGSIQVNSVTGGTPGYQYSIDGGATFQASNTFTGLAPNNYTVIARDINNCASAGVPITILSGVVFSPSVSFTDASCSGVDDGTIQVNSVSGGSAPYTYSIDGGANFQVSNSFTGLAPGNYDVIARDNNGCFSTTQVVTIGTGLSFDPTATSTPASCSGVNDGSIQVTGTTGGTPTFTYSNDGGATFQASDTFTGLASGNYNIVVQDANTCLSTVLVVNVGTGLSFDPTATSTAASCSGVNDGSIQVTGTTGGLAPFTYSNDGGTTFQISDTFTGLATGNYNIVVQDANTCLSTILVVNVGSGLSFDPTATSTAASCSGVNDGSIQVTGTTGGLAPFTYSNDGGTTFQISDTFTGLASGNYNIVVQDANTCLSTVLVVNVGTGLSFDPTATSTAASCSGVNDGSIQVTGTTGGLAPFTYSNDGGTTFQISDTFTGLASGNYNIVVQDANTCISTTLVVNVGAVLSITTSVSKTDATCLGNDGSIAINSVSGGTGPYSYSIDNGVTFQLSNLFNPVVVGNYNVVVRDANLCLSAVTPITINLPGGCAGANCFAFTISVDPVQTFRPSCGNQNDGQITLTISGSVVGPYILQLLKPSDPTFTAITQVVPAGTYSFPGLSPGNYEYRIQDQAGNICTQPYSLPVETTVDADATGFVDAACFGEATGQAVITVLSGGNSPYLYSLDNGVSWVSFTSPHNITDLLPSATPYSILVADDATDQCPDEVMVTIGNATTQINIGLSTTSATCGNNDGAINITTPASGASGGPYSYLMDGITAAPVGNVFEDLNGGSHTLTVIDDLSGCQRDFTVVVPFPGFVVTSSISASSGSCTAGGSISFFINSPGAVIYEIGYTTDFFNEPTNYSTAYYTPPLIPTDDGFVQIPDLPRGDYYVWVRSTTAQCPTRINSTPESIGGPYEITFDIGCRETNGDLYLMNIQGAPGLPFTYEIVGASTITGVVNVDVMNNAIITGFATDPYQVRLSQDQSSIAGCVVTTGFFAAPSGALDITSVDMTESFPEQPSGSMLVKIQESGAEPYEVWVVDNLSFISTDTIIAVRNPVIFEANFNNLGGGGYTIYVEDARGCRKEVIRDLPLDGDIFIPNIFTPNGDDKNQNFYVRNLPDGSKLSVTNRWGKEVYSSNNYSLTTLWDGDGVPDGIYYYRLQINGGKTYTGWVEILRGTRP